MAHLISDGNVEFVGKQTYLDPAPVRGRPDPKHGNIITFVGGEKYQEASAQQGKHYPGGRSTVEIVKDTGGEKANGRAPGAGLITVSRPGFLR